MYSSHQDLQRDVLALQLPVNRCPIRLGATAMPLLLSGCGEELSFEHRVGHVGRQWPTEPGGSEPLQRQPNRRRRHADPTRDLVAGHTGGLQPKHVAHLAHRDPLCWHRPLPRQKPKERTLSGPAETPSTERLHPAMPSEIISEQRATSNRNGGRDHPGIPGDFSRNQHAGEANEPRIRARHKASARSGTFSNQLVKERRRPISAPRRAAHTVSPETSPEPLPGGISDHLLSGRISVNARSITSNTWLGRNGFL